MTKSKQKRDNLYYVNTCKAYCYVQSERLEQLHKQMDCVFMGNWHDFQLHQLSTVAKLHKGCVITSASLDVFTQ